MRRNLILAAGLFASSGWTPSRSTLLNLLVASAFVIRPLAAYCRQLILASGVLGTDDTTVTLLLPPNLPPLVEGDAKSARTHEVFQQAMDKGEPSVTARMWAYRSMTVPLNVFDFTVARRLRRQCLRKSLWPRSDYIPTAGAGCTMTGMLNAPPAMATTISTS